MFQVFPCRVGPDRGAGFVYIPWHVTFAVGSLVPARCIYMYMYMYEYVEYALWSSSQHFHLYTDKINVYA